jgi:hypothetical protein
LPLSLQESEGIVIAEGDIRCAMNNFYDFLDTGEEFSQSRPEILKKNAARQSDFLKNSQESPETGKEAHGQNRRVFQTATRSGRLGPAYGIRPAASHPNSGRDGKNQVQGPG